MKEFEKEIIIKGLVFNTHDEYIYCFYYDEDDKQFRSVNFSLESITLSEDNKNHLKLYKEIKTTLFGNKKTEYSLSLSLSKYSNISMDAGWTEHHGKTSSTYAQGANI